MALGGRTLRPVGKAEPAAKAESDTPAGRSNMPCTSSVVDNLSASPVLPSDAATRSEPDETDALRGKLGLAFGEFVPSCFVALLRTRVTGDSPVIGLRPASSSSGSENEIGAASTTFGNSKPDAIRVRKSSSSLRHCKEQMLAFRSQE